ncbi:MAG: hypothetical protein Q4Q62_02080 [Thermoplasmata archaeon]|nr:hypothetical protein [Thermoplasmata archaeon]
MRTLARGASTPVVSIPHSMAVSIASSTPSRAQRRSARRSWSR